MSRKSWTESEEERLAAILESGQTAHDAARELGRSVASIQNKMYKGGLTQKGSVQEKPMGEGCSFSDKGSSATLITVDRKIKTADDAVRYAEVDTKVWEIERFVVNKWEQGSKDDDGGVNVVELWQVKVWLRRKVSELQQKSFEFLHEVISSAKWKPPKRADKRVDGEHMLEVSLFDAHFGKLCWEQETGTDYDTDIAGRFFLNAVDDLLADNRDLSIEKVLFPVGQDFFNVDNLRRETTGGTPQDVDDRYHRVFAKGFEAVVAAIERCRKIAPVHVVFIEGNHDTLGGWHLSFALLQLYSNCKDVEVDVRPKSRKYIKYGKTLLGITHGDGEKPSDRTTLMAREASEHWHGCDFYEWHTGHYHAEKKLQQAGTETNGIVERVLPSLSGTDRWHSKKGYTLNRQAAMAFAYHKEKGMRRTSYAYAR